MTTLASHPASSIVKLLNLGESKSGKTGALASLALAGYNLFVLDYDSGLDILVNVLRGNTSALARIHYRTLRDTIRLKSGLPMVAPPVHAYKDAGKALEEWVAERGPFTPADVLVLDTLTMFSEAAFNQALAIGGRLNQRPQQSDFGWMADSVKAFIGMVTDPEEFPCHVIVNTHIRYLGGEDEAMTKAKEDAFSAVRGLPNAKGQEVSRTVSNYFNTVVLTRTMGSGPGARRLITTQPQGAIEVATSAPASVKPTYPIDTGLAQLFQDILGHGGPSTSNIPTTQKA